jgi:TRAP transporter TAXI family solute receptor
MTGIVRSYLAIASRLALKIITIIQNGLLYMRVMFFHYRILIIFLAFFAGHSSAEIGLITGPKTGTYIQIAEDIARLVKPEGLTVKVYDSNGSLENIAAVFERPEVQLGLVQSDVLGYLQESQNRKLERVAQQVAMMFPLYNEEVHLLAKKDITSLNDLNHRVVAVGSKGSGTNLTSELLFEMTNVWPQRKYLLSNEEALQWLEQGKVDALFSVSGFPIKLFENIDPERFHLVPLKEESVGGYYIRSHIPAGVYAWQSAPIETIAVKAVLMTAGFNNTYCQAIDQLMLLIRNNIHYLKREGHPKWKEVTLDYALNNWDRYGCLAAHTEEVGG